MLLVIVELIMWIDLIMIVNGIYFLCDVYFLVSTKMYFKIREHSSENDIFGDNIGDSNPDYIPVSHLDMVINNLYFRLRKILTDNLDSLSHFEVRSWLRAY